MSGRTMRDFPYVLYVYIFLSKIMYLLHSMFKPFNHIYIFFDGELIKIILIKKKLYTFDLLALTSKMIQPFGYKY